MKNIFITLTFLCYSQMYSQIELVDKSLDSIIKQNLELDISDVITSEKASTLTVLNAFSSKINNLSGLSNFKNLKILNLNGNNISDISEIALLPNLRFVILANNSITDVLPLLTCTSESLEIDVSQNCITNLSIIESNLINPITFIGGNDQKDDCAIVPTFLDQFDIISTDVDTKEVQFLYRGYHPTLQNGTIDFGNGESTNVILNGDTQVLTYKYSSGDDFSATLSLNDKSLQTNVGFAINPLILTKPLDKTTNNINVWVNEVFNWQKVEGDVNYEISISKDETNIDGRITDSNELNFDVFELEEIGDYQWKVRAFNNYSYGSWSDSFTFSIVSALNTDDFNSKEINVYPNPVKDFLIIKVENLKTIIISDINGKTLTTFTSKNIDLRNLNSGIYILKITNKENRVKTLKIVKQ